MIAPAAGATGLCFVPTLAALGFDYVELPLAEMTALPEAEFAESLSVLRDSGIPCLACNNFFPATLRLTGPEVDAGLVAAYLDKSLARAAAIGARTIVFGSGPAKSVPEDFPREKAYGQIVELLRTIASAAARLDLHIAIEPLRRAECNIVNTFAEACNLADEVGSERIRVLIDYYHMTEEGERIGNLAELGAGRLFHAHFARRHDRRYPVNANEDPGYAVFFSVLGMLGYEGGVSLEAYTGDFANEAPVALSFLRKCADSGIRE